MPWSDRQRGLVLAAALFAASLLLFLGVGLGVWMFGAVYLGSLVAVGSLLCAIFIVTVAYGVFFGAPFVPIDRRRAEAMLDLAGLRPGERLADLGSGDGRVLIAAAKRGVYAEGWEINPYLWLISIIAAWQAGCGARVRVHLGSYWHDRLAGFDVVTLFLITSQMPRMRRKLWKEMRPGSRVASYAFVFPDWIPETKADGGLYLYKVPGEQRDPANIVKES